MLQAADGGTTAGRAHRELQPFEPRQEVPTGRRQRLTGATQPAAQTEREALHGGIGVLGALETGAERLEMLERRAAGGAAHRLGPGRPAPPRRRGAARAERRRRPTPGCAGPTRPANVASQTSATAISWRIAQPAGDWVSQIHVCPDSDGPRCSPNPWWYSSNATRPGCSSGGVSTPSRIIGTSVSRHTVFVNQPPSLASVTLPPSR